MKKFHLLRTQDESGVSGTGVIAEGAMDHNGVCFLSWLTKYQSWGIYPSMETLENIHGHGGKTQIVYDEPAHA
jgi:hypothetical protein